MPTAGKSSRQRNSWPNAKESSELEETIWNCWDIVSLSIAERPVLNSREFSRGADLEGLFIEAKQIMAFSAWKYGQI